jgi:MFS family permease
LPASEAASLLLILTGAMTVSGLATGALTSLAKRCGLAPMEFAVATAGLFALVLVVLFFQWTPSPFVVFVTWALFGFIAALSFVIYAALGPEFAPQLTGRLNACLTLSWMLGAFFIQNIYGIVLDRFPKTAGGYSIEAHSIGIGVIIVLLVAAMGWFFIAIRLIERRTAAAAQ